MVRQQDYILPESKFSPTSALHSVCTIRLQLLDVFISCFKCSLFIMFIHEVAERQARLLSHSPKRVFVRYAKSSIHRVSSNHVHLIFISFVPPFACSFNHGVVFPKLWLVNG